MAEHKRPKLLLVEDDQGLQRQLAWAFDDFEVLKAEDRPTAEAVLDQEKPSVVLLDLGLPPDADGPSEGLATLQAVLRASPDSKVIMMSGQTEREFALKAVALGAYDFYQKPLSVDEIRLIVGRAQRLYELEQENRRLARHQGGTPLPGVLTSNPAMLEVCSDIAALAATNVSVLVVGESGTGKELLARALHEFSPRAKGPFVAVNCAAIPETLLESEFFGHEKGAFTGAFKTTTGKVECANKGTLFLDEIGDMPPPLQAKLLRFLQERTIERVGGHRQIPVDIRVVSATNQDLQAMIQEGSFRQDLYYRVSEGVVEIPPLRDRPEDAALIANKLARDYAQELGRRPYSLSRSALAAILAHSWPGNVRELQNCIKRAVASAAGPVIPANDLRLGGTSETAEGPLTLKQARFLAESKALRQALAIANGNISEAARVLDTSRPTLYQLLKQHAIEP
ncbi:PEP-CTERM-box response regulator transcription factor [Pelagibius marinus]|uniref:PEP-CTERM-box response regulator transcription factor n=1 Tax=Pelagibius marinus TaxID=2762760 RepID=UPI001872BACE|nr:PEP-CTERM-box response regulator transcription factor [Pelagibius marinus]